jgi:uroporphyrinogen decarboxylase
MCGVRCACVVAREIVAFVGQAGSASWAWAMSPSPRLKRLLWEGLQVKPRDRVLAALAHREADRVPCDLGATVDTGIHHVAYRKLLEHMGKRHLIKPADETRFIDLGGGLAQVDPEVAEALKVDARGLLPGGPSTPKQANIQRAGDDEVLVDLLGAKWFRPPGGYYFDQKEGSYPLQAATTVADLEAYPWPEVASAQRLKGLRDSVKALGQDYAIIMGDPVGGVFASGFRLRGYMEFYLDLGGDHAFAGALMDKLTEVKLRYWDAILSEVGDLIDIALFEDDLGQQDRTMVSPKMYRELILPRHRQLFSFVKQKMSGSVRVMLHSDGSLYDIIPDLIEAGVDILNPIQVSAAKMDTKSLKREFGKDLVFWGAGADSQGVLGSGSADQVEEEVKRRIDDLAPGGGFVFSTIHNIQPEVPPANIVAMYETAHEYGKY